MTLGAVCDRVCLDTMAHHEALYPQVGKLIRQHREALSITQETLAADVGLTRTSISNIERGRQKLLLHTLYAIASTLKVEAAELMPKGEQAGQPREQDLNALPADVRAFVEAGIGAASRK